MPSFSTLFRSQNLVPQMALHMLQTTVDVLDGRQTAGRRGPVQHADFGGGRHGNVTGAAVVRDMSGHENL